MNFSSYLEITRGAPQGSIFGPILFNLFLNDLMFFIKETEVRNFADDTHREKVPLNKIPASTKSMNMSIWVVGTSNQLFIRGSSTKSKFPKNKVVRQNVVFCDRSILYSPFYLF